MAASNKALESKEPSLCDIDKLPRNVKRHILRFFDHTAVGKKFQYGERTINGKSIKGTFCCNLLVLCEYLDSAQLAETIALNLLWNVAVEETLVVARHNPKCLPFTALNQDHSGQWIEATPLQTVYAAGDRNPPTCDLFLMSSPESSKSYKKSDKTHLYLYKKNQDEIFYFTEDEKKFELEKKTTPQFVKDFPFDQLENNPVKCSNFELCAIVLEITSKRNHTLPPPDAKNFGLVERLSECFENPQHAVKQLEEWKKGSEEATNETMERYYAAIDNLFNDVIKSDEITNGVNWRVVIALPIYLLLDKNFREALLPNPNHVVRKGFLFSMEIYLYLIKKFIDNEKDLGGLRSRKSDVLDTIATIALQGRVPRCDLGNIFSIGFRHAAEGKTPEKRFDYANDTPARLVGIGTTDFFSCWNSKWEWPGPPTRAFPTSPHTFQVLWQAKITTPRIKQLQPEPTPSRCAIM